MAPIVDNTQTPALGRGEERIDPVAADSCHYNSSVRQDTADFLSTIRRTHASPWMYCRWWMVRWRIGFHGILLLLTFLCGGLLSGRRNRSSQEIDWRTKYVNKIKCFIMLFCPLYFENGFLIKIFRKSITFLITASFSRSDLINILLRLVLFTWLLFLLKLNAINPS